MTSGLLAFEVPYICKLNAATLIVLLSVVDDGICGVDFGSGDIVAVGSGCLPGAIGSLSITVGFL
jgi:hypothetical protein